MKYFGFLKEHGDYKYAESIKDLIVEDGIENPNRKKIIDYLKKGTLCVAQMGFVEDATHPKFNEEDFDDNEFMGYTAINTDGEWYWPQYISNYLEKYPSIRIDGKFVKHVLSNKEKIKDLSEEEILKLEKNYIEKAGFKKEK